VKYLKAKAPEQISERSARTALGILACTIYLAAGMFILATVMIDRSPPSTEANQPSTPRIFP